MEYLCVSKSLEAECDDEGLNEAEFEAVSTPSLATTDHPPHPRVSVRTILYVCLNFYCLQLRINTRYCVVSKELGTGRRVPETFEIKDCSAASMELLDMANDTKPVCPLTTSSE